MMADQQQLLAAIVARPDLEKICESGFSLDSFVQAGYASEENTLDVIAALHDLVRVNSHAMNDNLQHRLRYGEYQEIADGVFSADNQALPAHVVTNTRQGPIVLESGWSIGPFSFLEGPIHLGPNNRVIEHASIKEAVCTGPTCKLGGEIEATIIEGFTNKQHHGFLGHSYLGSWINLGAGTCNSDLKNTYGKVNMRRHGEKIETGMQFLGCFVGDYAKTAINTSIFTGKTIGECSLVYGFATNNVAPFTNDAQLWGKATAVDPQVMIQTQGRMFARREVVQRDCDRELITAMFELTRDQRDGLICEPLVF